MNIEALYEKKLGLLNRVYELTSNVVFTDDLESNVNKYTALYKKRAELFQEIYNIDDKIKKLYPEKPNANDAIHEVIKQILVIDQEIDKNKDAYKSSLMERAKGFKQSRKTREKFDPYSKNDYSTFESKA